MEAIQAIIRRKGDTGNANSELRRQGWVPAVVYGKEIGNLSIQMNGKELDQSLRHQATNKPFKLVINGNEHTVMITELQRHPVRGNILHADFRQINMNEKIHTSVPIVLAGDPELGVATLVRHSVEVACLPDQIPESFTVSVDGLNIGDVVLVKDLEIPPGIDVGLDEMEVIVSVLPTKEKSDQSIEAEQAAQAVAEAAESPVEEAKKG
jgi:large subunit ribosomal protein L25